MHRNGVYAAGRDRCTTASALRSRSKWQGNQANERNGKN
jgi:hypothetical protein